jgi:hypothetical protein
MDLSDPLVIPAILMSDYVVREMGTGKLSLVGIFSQWNCPHFPFQTPAFWVTPFLTNFRGNPKEVNLTVKIEQCQSGHTLASAAAKIQFPPEITIQSGVMVEIPFPIASINLAQPGNYRVVVLVNDEKIAERIFTVVATNSPASPMGKTIN